MNAASILKSLRDEGFTISLKGDDRLVVGPASKLHDTQRELLRAHKLEILGLLKFAANDPEPPTDPSTWRELAHAYHAHHFNCKTCISAGGGLRYGLRCGVGATLWTNYQST